MNIVKGILLGGSLFGVSYICFVLFGGVRRLLHLSSNQFMISPISLAMISLRNPAFWMSLAAFLLLGVAYFMLRRQMA